MNKMNILICGIGAIGSNLTRLLASDLKGEHKITILDYDVVEERNLQAGTQFFMENQIGQPKVEALQYNIYKIYRREVDILNERLTKSSPTSHILLGPDDGDLGYDLAVDCFDNHESRQLFVQARGDVTHIGFSDQFTYEIGWNPDYQTPDDLKSDLDICEMQGAAAFVNSVASLGALAIQSYIHNNNKLEIVGGRYHSRIIK